MFNLFRSSRGQIRGIDFSLAIIIFTLTMGQILLLTNTFIDGNRSEIDFAERQEKANSIANQLITNSGYGQDTELWTDVSTNNLIGNSTWNIGLSTNGELDPLKLGRISNRSISNLELNYTAIRSGLNITNDLRIRVVNPISLTITGISNAGSTITVNVQVTKSATPLFQAKLWLFAIDSGVPIESQGETDSSGTFTFTFNANSANEFVTIMIIARYGFNSEDVAIQNYAIGTVNAPVIERMSVVNNTQTNNVHSVGVIAEMSEQPEIFAFYPGYASGVNNFTSAVAVADGSNWNVSSLAVPQSKSVIFFARGAGGSIAYVNFPLTVNDVISKIIEPTVIPASTSASKSTSILVRGLIMEFILTIWV